MTEDVRLNAMATIARDAGLWSIAEAAYNNSERLRAGLFYVVCVGQFKRGKSTLLNALLDTTVLPTAVVPVTSTVTIVRHGERLAARMRFRGRDWEDCDPAAIGLYVSEQHNPGNEKDVLAVEVTVPSPLLERGLCLVDTPGLGSVIFANSEATRAFVPHVDAAIIVLGADPPISAEELALVQELARTVRDIIVVLNKADRHSTAERAEVIRFTERVLEQAGHHAEPILQVSASERLAGDQEGRDWPALVDRLRTLARESDATLISAARQRETAALVAQLRAGLEDQRVALLRPIEESERRVAEIRETMIKAERILVDVRHLLNAEQECLVRRFAEERNRFFESALPSTEAALRRAMSDGPSAAWQLRTYALDQAQAISRRVLDEWRKGAEPQADALYKEAERRFVELLEGVRERLRALTSLRSLAHMDPAPGFRVQSGLYYTELMHVSSPSPATWVLDRAFPWWRRRAVERHARDYFRRLFDVNSARVKNDLEHRLTESRRALERDLTEALQGLVTSAETALAEARRAHANGTAGVRERLNVIETLRRRLEEVCARGHEGVDGPLA